jgi:integrase
MGVHNHPSMSTTQPHVSTSSPLKNNDLHRCSDAVIHENENPENTVEDTKSVQEVSGVSRGKTHADYWLKKVFRATYQSSGARRETGCFSVKIQFAGRRESFPLNTSNRAEAARKAKQIWVSLAANGWDKTLAQFKPQAVYIPPTFVTVGDYLNYLEEHRLYSPQALYRNVTKFFTALGSMFETNKPRTRFDARGDGLKKWREKLRAVKLADLTPARIEMWKANYLALRAESPVRTLHAKHTLDGYIRASKAMFGPKIRKRLADFGVTFPEPIPFANTAFVTRGRSAFRYRSRIDPYQLTNLAFAELQQNQPELLKIFLLALHLGLRRNEIDKLLWSQFNFDERKLRIEVTEYAQLKTEGSEDDIGLEPELADFFQREFKKTTGIFVIEAVNKPRKTNGWDHYRADSRFSDLCVWLRAKGVDAQKPLHTLRKEFGKLITEKLGLFAASLALRHTSPTVTATYYADDSRPKHTGLGKLIRLEAVSS